MSDFVVQLDSPSDAAVVIRPRCRRFLGSSISGPKLIALQAPHERIAEDLHHDFHNRRAQHHPPRASRSTRSPDANEFMGLTVTISLFDEQIATIADVPYRSGINVEQAMRSAFDANPGSRSMLGFALEFFGASLGYGLTTLGAVASQRGGDGRSWLFWELLINDQPSRGGIDETFPAANDTIGWNYTLYCAARHAGTRYEAIRRELANR